MIIFEFISFKRKKKTVIINIKHYLLAPLVKVLNSTMYYLYESFSFITKQQKVFLINILYGI